MQKQKESGVGVFILKMLAICAVLSACVKRVELWDGGPSMDFFEGLDIHAGANGIDNVTDVRGVGNLPAAPVVRAVKGQN